MDRRVFIVILCVLSALFATGAARAAAPPIHLGAETCAGSGCHGAAEARAGTNVQQNEVSLWRTRDPHARAWKVLEDPRGQRIAHALGIAGAGSAARCLSCHADGAPQEMRGQMFRVSDGVSCEACHGASAPWLGLHASGVSTHAQNVAAGLYPTEQPRARAELCLNCHMGDGSRFVSHDIMAAGHPALRFDLATYTNTLPLHWQVDADYRSRKNVPDRIAVWASGEIAAASRTLSLVAVRRGGPGAPPELGVFDCGSCHRPMKASLVAANGDRGIGPGAPRLADADIVMVRVLLQAFQPDAAAALRSDWQGFHRAARSGDGTFNGAIASLKGRIAAAGGLGMRAYDLDARRHLLATFVAEAGAGGLSDFSVARQATMAMGTVVAGLKESGLEQGRIVGADAALDSVYEAVASDRTYEPGKWVAAVDRLGAAIATE